MNDISLFNDYLSLIIKEYRKINDSEIESVIYELFHIKNFNEIISNQTIKISEVKDNVIIIKGELSNDIMDLKTVFNKMEELFSFILYQSMKIVKSIITEEKLSFYFITASDISKIMFSGEIVFQGNRYQELYLIYKQSLKQLNSLR